MAETAVTAPAVVIEGWCTLGKARRYWRVYANGLITSSADSSQVASAQIENPSLLKC